MLIRTTSGALNITCCLLLRHLTICFFIIQKKKESIFCFIIHGDGEGDAFKWHETLGKSSKELVPIFEEYVEESGERNNKLHVPASEQPLQIEQK